jgi:hypothetical protein
MIDLYVGALTVQVSTNIMSKPVFILAEDEQSAKDKIYIDFVGKNLGVETNGAMVSLIKVPKDMLADIAECVIGESK